MIEQIQVFENFLKNEYFSACQIISKKFENDLFQIQQEFEKLLNKKSEYLALKINEFQNLAQQKKFYIDRIKQKDEFIATVQKHFLLFSKKNELQCEFFATFFTIKNKRGKQLRIEYLECR